MESPTLLVVDVGNTRIKWGRCDAWSVVESVALLPDDTTAWQHQLDIWHLQYPLKWIVSGVHPARRYRLAEWLRARGDSVQLLVAPTQLPLRTALAHPEKVGIDRLLDAVAVNSRRRAGGAAVIVDAGTAVTVDFLDRDGVFRGGAILPGLGLMAKSLHDYTALLPLVDVVGPVSMPAESTIDAMRAGIFAAVAGGMERLIVELSQDSTTQVFVSGGDAAILAKAMGRPVEVWPLMTLEGLRLTATSPLLT